MSNILFNYPLDLTGRSFTNRVVNEAYKIGVVKGRIFAPKGGPFYGNSTTFFDIDTGRELIAKKDYKLLHYYPEAADRADQPVYAAVQIVNPEVSENVGMTTQYVGGEFSWSYEAIVDAIRALEADGRPVYWGELIGMPGQFNPTNHLHDIRNSYGWQSVAYSIARLEDAILKGSTASMRLLVDTVDAKLQAIDIWLGEGLDVITQLNEEMDVRFEDYDATVRGYLDAISGDINETIKPIPIRAALFDIKPNNRYDLSPIDHTVAQWTVGLTIPSDVIPKAGDYIELRAVRDGCTISINALNAPIVYLDNRLGNKTLKTVGLLKDIRVGAAGVRLVWNQISERWQLITEVDPDSVVIDKFHLKEVATDGGMDLAVANSFVLADIEMRVVKFINLPTDRSMRVYVTVQGNGIVFWPPVLWPAGTPTLGKNNTVVTLHYSAGRWIGSSISV